MGWKAGALVVAGAVVLAARRTLVVVNVSGTSMEPTLRNGDRILVRRRRPEQVRRGEITVLAAPEAATAPEWQCATWHVKRVVALPGDPVPAGVPVPADRVPAGSVVALGDNDVGGDSRTWGPYRADGVVGTYVLRLRTGTPSRTR
ncbi:signal peptidase I [Pseudonocardia sp. CA-107938]|uniref:signal peptidase I n=1 Tax=Pseudonocardia sp. CA-107938 TaxID=3240021 RepID=UPI003D8A4A0F